MARTANSSKSESVTLRIPNELFTQIKAHAEARTRGNASLAIVELLEAGLSAVDSKQAVTVQDNALHSQLQKTRETVTALAQQVEQITKLMQDTVLQRLAKVESELLGESNA